MNTTLLLIIFMAILVAVATLAYYTGRCAGIAHDRVEVLQAQAELATVNAVRHNLNCLVSDLRYEVSVLKPDADAYKASKGLWCTDQPNLIRHHAKKERFFRLGYPGHRL